MELIFRLLTDKDKIAAVRCLTEAFTEREPLGVEFTDESIALDSFQYDGERPFAGVTKKISIILIDLLSLQPTLDNNTDSLTLLARL